MVWKVRLAERHDIQHFSARKFVLLDFSALSAWAFRFTPLRRGQSVPTRSGYTFRKSSFGW